MWRERGGRLPEWRYAQVTVNMCNAKWLEALFNDLLLLDPTSPLALPGYVFGSHKCPTLASEILQPVLGFCFFSNLTKFQFKTHSGCNNSLKRKKKNTKKKYKI